MLEVHQKNFLYILNRQKSSKCYFYNTCDQWYELNDVLNNHEHCYLEENLQVRVQAGGCLWNFSHEDLVKNTVDISELIPALISMLESESVDMESATGILANFSTNQRNHELLVAAGIVNRLVFTVASIVIC